MEAFTTILWSSITAAGGTLALTLIVAIAVGIGALALLFFGSAVVALARFARAAKSWRSALGPDHGHGGYLLCPPTGTLRARRPVAQALESTLLVVS